MGRVFVAGSINMDVVATADRHPRIGETVAAARCFTFPWQGREPGVAAAITGCADDADRPAWQGCVRRSVEGVPYGLGVSCTKENNVPAIRTPSTDRRTHPSKPPDQRRRAPSFAAATAWFAPLPPES